MGGAQRERFKRIPSSHAKADDTVALDALAQKRTQEPHNEKDIINSDDAVACGAAAQAATHHRATRRLNTQRERAKITLSSSVFHGSRS